MRGRRSLLLTSCCVIATDWSAARAAGRRPRHEPQTRAAPDAGSPAQTSIGPLDTMATWAIIVDHTTGSVILEKSADETMPPSSLTKLMTAYLVFGMLKTGRLRLDQALPVSERAWRMQGSKMFVPLGQQVKVEDLIRGMIIQSGNDACIVLAEGIAGSEEQFVNRMNEAAQHLGMTHTVFTNATGWPDPEHHMSARDIATLTSALLADFPEYYHFFGEKSYSFNNIDQGNRNVLVDKGLADGLKTGHTDAGGFGLCASAERNGRRLIMVLNGMPTSRARIEESERLLDWAFANFEDVRLYAAGDPVDKVPVWLGAKSTATLVSRTDVVVTMPHGWQTVTKIAISYVSPVAAPVAANQTLATLSVEMASMSPRIFQLVSAESIGRMALPLRSIAVLEHAVLGS